jgi:hypothetical protein
LPLPPAEKARAAGCEHKKHHLALPKCPAPVAENRLLTMALQPQMPAQQWKVAVAMMIAVRVNIGKPGSWKTAVAVLRNQTGHQIMQLNRKDQLHHQMVGYSDTPSNLKSFSRGDDEEINYQPKFTSGILITNRADINRMNNFACLYQQTSISFVA